MAEEQITREAIGRRLRATREGQGRTAVWVAREAGITPRYLSDLEAGGRNPSAMVVGRLAQVLGTSLDEIVLGREVRL